MVLLLILQSLWFVAPAYISNGFPPVMQGRRPIDRGKRWNGKRILGNGKTVEGTLGGILVGFLAGTLQVIYQDHLVYLGLGLPEMTFPLVAALSVGAMAGDLAGSFIKRRLDVNRGEAMPGLDQLGFLVFAFLFAAAVHEIDALILATLVLITPPIHLFTNVIGYWMKFKKQPW